VCIASGLKIGKKIMFSKDLDLLKTEKIEKKIEKFSGPLAPTRGPDVVV